MNRLYHLLWTGTLALLLTLGLTHALDRAAAAPAVAAPSAPACQPAVIFTTVPPYGSFADLQGAATCLATPTDYSVAVYIYVAGWWTKPTLANPLTPVQPDGTWTTDITTGGSDEEATKIAAFLLPNGVTPPAMLGGAPLPASLYTDAVAYTHVERTRRELTFAGRTWLVKHSDYPEGPGPNYFSDDPQDVWVDAQGRLHLRIAFRNGRWHSAEVISAEPFGYGTYEFVLESPVDHLNENVVLGLFTWDSVAPPAAHDREVDIEFSRWGSPGNPNNAQYVLQPWQQPGNLHRFTVTLPLTTSLHRFDWQPGRVDFATYQGAQPAPGHLLYTWSLTGSSVLPADDSSARINLWLFNGVPPSDGQEVEVVISDFRFTPHVPTWHVSNAGSDAPGCGSQAAPCATIPYAVSHAADGNAVHVAQGAYPGTLVLTKTVQLRGGYHPTTWQRDIAAYPTILDGQQAGSVIQVLQGSAALIEGFDITNGRAANGGGILVDSAAPVIQLNDLFNNTAISGGGAVYLANDAVAQVISNTIHANTAVYGGGLYVTGGAAGVIGGNDIYQNSASYGGGLYINGPAAPLVEGNTIRNHGVSIDGGGLYIASGATPIIRGNVIRNNTTGSFRWGGGILIANASPQILSNTITSNGFPWTGWGGGLYIAGGSAEIGYNDIGYNRAEHAATSTGGGIQVEYGTPHIHHNDIHHNYGRSGGGGMLLKSFSSLTDNVIHDNTASVGGGASLWGSSASGPVERNTFRNNGGAGLYVWYYAHPAVRDNLFEGNSGSGIYVASNAYPTIDRNRVVGNSGTYGGGIRLSGAGTVQIRNTAVLSNQATIAGSGIYVSSSTPQLKHVTLAGNAGGDGSGIHIASANVSVIQNSLIADHTVGVLAGAGGQATLGGVLWHGNVSDTSGSVTVNHAVTGDPAFDTDGYHLTAGSAAVDQGINAGVTTDIDNTPRPQGGAPDLGADEYVRPNHPPTAVADAYTLTEDTARAVAAPGVLVNDGDLDGDPLLAILGTRPLHGTLSFYADGSFTYTPATNFNGQDSFTYQAYDGRASSLLVTVLLTVTAVNDPPLLGSHAVTTNEDEPTTIDLLAGGSDVDGSLDPATLTIAVSPTKGSVTVDPVTGIATYTPNPNENGADSFDYQVCDDDTPLPPQCATATVTITILPVNDPPIAADHAVTTDEDEPTTIDLLAGGSDVDGSLDPATVSIVAAPAHGTVIVDPATGMATFTPNANENGTDGFIYQVCDDGTPLPPQCDTAVVTLTILPVNDPPNAADHTVTTNEDVTQTINLLAGGSDIDGNLDPTSIAIVTPPIHGTVTVDPVSGIATYVPDPNENGSDSFVYEVCDDGTPLPPRCDTATVTVTIVPVNDPPVAADHFVTTDEDVTQTINLLAGGVDVDGSLDPATVSIVAAPAHGTVIVDPATGMATFTPNANENGTDDFIYRVCDDGTPLPPRCDTAVVTMTIRPINDAPVVAAGADATVSVGTAVSFAGSLTDPDPLDTHAIEWDFGNGQIVTGTLTPTHTFASIGVYTITLTVTDAAGAAGQDTVQVTVTAQSFRVFLPAVFTPPGRR